MKKLIRFSLLILVFIVLVLLVIGMVLQSLGIPEYENNAPQLQITPDSVMVFEGARMASMLCIQCHGSQDGRMGGRHMVDAAMFGEIYAPNITQHPELGIADYSDGELAYLLRTGIKNNGQYAPAYMIKLPLLSDEDLYSLIAFLRSDHPYVQPSNTPSMPSKPNFLTTFLTRTSMKPLAYPSSEMDPPDISNTVEWGKYLSTAKFDCYSCHSKSFVTTNPMEPQLTPGYFGGGNAIIDLDGKKILSANLTMDQETGLGTWTRSDFIKVVKFGVRPDGSVLRYPMLPYTMLYDEEISAIWDYLQSIPVISNNRDRTPS